MLRHSSSGHQATVYYQIRCGRLIKTFSSFIRVNIALWDGRQPVIESVREKINSDMERIHRIAGTCGDGDLDEIVRKFRSHSDTAGLRGFISACAAHLEQEGRFGTGRNYRSTLRNISEYLGESDPSLTDIDNAWIQSYQDWLHRRQVSPNTISFYMRALKAVMRRAARQGLISGADHFDGIFTGNRATRKRAVDTEAIRRLSRLDLRKDPGLQLARDIFLFSVMTRGMSFVDIAFLRNDNITDGILTYTRRKTHRVMTIRIEPQAERIINRYRDNNRKLVFPILNRKGRQKKDAGSQKDERKDEYEAYLHAIDAYNRRLLRLGRLIGLETRLTSYVARHTWATLVHKKNVPISVISAALGHASERTTTIYLADIDNHEIDAANKLLIDDLF